MPPEELCAAQSGKDNVASHVQRLSSTLTLSSFTSFPLVQNPAGMWRKLMSFAKSLASAGREPEAVVYVQPSGVVETS